jgi:trehalose 6-phosphate phosphatase
MSRSEAVLESPHRWALFIDIDGTLLGMAPTPDAVRVPASLIRLLERLAGDLGGALALLTGRRIANADRLFAPLELVAAGVHGTELRSERGGQITALAPPMPAGVITALNELSHLADGILVEQKGAGLAVHYRNAPHMRQILEAKLMAIMAASCGDLLLRQGRMVLEIGPKGFSKGTALGWLAARPPFKGRLPVMVGDDAADESALIEAERLGGVALRVAGEHFGSEAADFDSVASVRAWLEALARALRASKRQRDRNVTAS